MTDKEELKDHTPPPSTQDPNEVKETDVDNNKPAESKEELPQKQEKEALLENGTNNDETAQIVPPQDPEEEIEQTTHTLRVYPRRWLVLATVAILNCTNTMAWIGFACIANHVNRFYGSEAAANYFSVIYMLVTVPVGILAMYLGRKFGLKFAIWTAALANCLGVLIRLGSSFLPLPSRYALGLIGQGTAAMAYPFIMFLPTKVAGTWFDSKQRGLATTIGVMSNPIGVLLANQISPRLVHAPEDVIYLNILVAIPSVLAALLAITGVNSSEPKTPPTLSAAAPQMEFLDGIKSCFQTPQYLILLVVMGGGIGMFNCLYTVMQQLLCPSGYDNEFAGWCSTLMIIGGVIGATASGTFVDRTKRYTETMKVCMTFAVGAGLLFLQLTNIESFGPYILANCFVFGVLGLAIYPVGLEMSAECTFPVTETTSTGLIVLSGQITSVIFVKTIEALQWPIPKERRGSQTCDPQNPDAAKDSFWGIIAVSAIAVLLVIVLIAFFKPVYKRMLAENQNQIQHGQLQSGVETAALTAGREVQHVVA